MNSMKFKQNNRQFLSLSVILFYLLPVLLFVSYSISLMPRHKSWSILSLGLLMMTGGSLALIWLLYYWEQTIKTQPIQEKRLIALSPNGIADHQETKVMALDPHFLATPQTEISSKENSGVLHAALKESQEKYEQLIKEKQRLDDENQQLSIKVEKVSQDFSDYKIFSEEQLKQRNLQISHFQQTIEDQRSEIEKYQNQIQALDTKVHDLSYEIKTLLYLHETENNGTQPVSHFEIAKMKTVALEPSRPAGEEEANNEKLTEKMHIQMAADAAQLLKRTVTLAQKITGTPYHGHESSRYREFSSPYHTIDQRRLFDHLRNETQALILVYSQKEQKIVFVNNQSKSLLGWSPDKFIQDFANLIQEGTQDWKKALEALSNQSESQTRLLCKTKNGQEVLLNCQLGHVATGLFKHYIIGILYPA